MELCKIVEIIHPNMTTRTFALTERIANKFVGKTTGNEPQNEVQRVFLEAVDSIIGVHDVYLNRTEVSVKVGEAFSDEEGWDAIRLQVVPLIVETFFKGKEPVYSTRDERKDDRDRHDGYDD